MRSLSFPVLLSVSLALSALPAAMAQEADRPIPETIEFNRDVRPILSDNCFFCHGPDKNKREASLRLDTQEGLLSADGHAAAVVPGKPDESELIRRILSTNPDEQMPPAKSGKVLSERDRQLLRRWIEQGGKFEGHWAFLAIRPPADVPAETPASKAIDDYVMKSIATNGLTPSPSADRVTLIRRLSFDLIGLPPTEAEVDTVDTFVATPSSDLAFTISGRVLTSTCR
jgi:hypothetical protein